MSQGSSANGPSSSDGELISLVDAAPLKGTAAAAAALDSIDFALMDEVLAGVFGITSVPQGELEMTLAELAPTTEAKEAWASLSAGAQSEEEQWWQAQVDGATAQQQSDNAAGTQELFTVEEMTALILSFGSEELSQELPMEGLDASLQDSVQATVTDSVSTEQTLPIAEVPISQSAQGENTLQDSNASASGSPNATSKGTDDETAKPAPAFPRLAARRGTNASSSVRLADVKSEPAQPEATTESSSADASTFLGLSKSSTADSDHAASPSPKSATAPVSATQPVRKSSEPIAALPFALRPSILSSTSTPTSSAPGKAVSTTTPGAPKSDLSSVTATQPPARKSSEPIAALPFSLRPSILSNTSTPTPKPDSSSAAATQPPARKSSEPIAALPFSLRPSIHSNASTPMSSTPEQAVSTTTPAPQSDFSSVAAAQPVQKSSGPIAALPFSLRPSILSNASTPTTSIPEKAVFTTTLAPKPDFSSVATTQPAQKASEPIAALPFSLRPSILSNASTPTSSTHEQALFTTTPSPKSDFSSIAATQSARESSEPITVLPFSLRPSDASPPVSSNTGKVDSPIAAAPILATSPTAQSRQKSSEPITALPFSLRPSILSDASTPTSSTPGEAVSTTPKPDFSSVATQPAQKLSEPIAALPFSLRPSILSDASPPVSSNTGRAEPPIAPAPIIDINPTAQSGQKSSEPVAALPFSLRPSTLSNAAAPVSFLPAETAPTPESFSATASAPATTCPAPVSVLPEINNEPAASDGPTFHDLLSGLPPVSCIPSPLAVPEPRNPAETRKPFRLSLELEPSSFGSYSATQSVRSKSSLGYVHEVYSGNTFSSCYYTRALETQTIRKTEHALSVADLRRTCRKPEQPRRETLSHSSIPLYNPGTDDYVTSLIPGYFADRDAVSDSDGSDWADNASLFGSDSGGFEYASDDYSTGSGQQRVNAAATVAGGAGYLVGSAVKAVLVGARSLAGWLTRRNMARQ